MYESTTQNIRITVEPAYLDEQSRPDENYHVWAYTIGIENHGDDAVTLKTRYWKITDAQGRVQEVRGAGVVGEQPTLEPGQRFEYTSGAPLTTETGFMVGAYQMQHGDGQMFEVDIPAFSLDSPHSTSKLH